MTDFPDSDRERIVMLPEDVVSGIEQRLSRTEFDTVDDYAAFALERLLREVGRLDDDTEVTTRSDDVEQRLESLGYL